MDPSGLHTILKNFPDDSADDDVSKTNTGLQELLLYIPECEESDSESDNTIPISQLASSSTRISRAQKFRWSGGFLERDETESQCTGDVSLPIEIKTLDIFPYIYQETNKYTGEKQPNSLVILL